MKISLRWFSKTFGLTKEKTFKMANIYHNFPVKHSPSKVFENIVTAQGLDNWWTKKAEVNPELGGIYLLDFGPGYVWKAKVSQFQPAKEFELTFTEADADWMGTRVGFQLNGRDNKTDVVFYHCGWPAENDHFKNSSYCWAMYLRILKRFTERGEQVAYERRLDV